MYSKKQILVAGLVAAAFAGAFIVGCSKNESDLLPGKPAQPGSRNGSQATILSAPPFSKAYLATSPVGLCEGPPFPAYDGRVHYFTASTGASETAFDYNTHCNYTGIAENPNNNTIYLTQEINGETLLLKVNPSTGAITQVAKIWLDAIPTGPFPVEEIEFDNNGNLFLLKRGEDRPLFKIAWSSILSPPTPADLPVTLVGNMFGFHRDQYLESLCVNGSTMYLVTDQSTTSNTKVYSINLGTAALTLVDTYPVPNTYTNNISSYYHAGNVYVVRDNGSGTGTIYKLISSSSVSTLGNTITAGVNHDAIYMTQFIP